ncbi:Uncharacterised protein [Chlamydia trachomatis]|nr:Uncharacterised protein [Chlamydia trachomatis]
MTLLSAGVGTKPGFINMALKNDQVKIAIKIAIITLAKKL